MTDLLSQRMAAMSTAGKVVSGRVAPGKRSAGLINLATGDPVLPTPSRIVDAAIGRLGEGNLTYTDVHGTPELKEAIRDKFAAENGLVYSDEQIAVSAGSKQVMINALLATVDPGDEVVVPTPYFAPYARMVALAGGVPRLVPSSPDNAFKLTPEQLIETTGKKTKWIIINSPSNPAGAVYAAEELTEIITAVLEVHPHVRFLSDEVYEHYCYDGHSATSVGRVSQEAFERTLTVNSVSKTYSMTGWRIGYGAGPAELIAAMRTVQHSTTTSPPQLSQVAATAALRLDRSVLDRRNASARDLLDHTTADLDEIPGITYLRPAGSIYVFVNCAGLVGSKTPDGAQIDSDTDLVGYLRDQFDVLVLPGSYYGASPYFRLTFVIDEADLAEGLKRLRAGIETLVSAA